MFNDLSLGRHELEKLVADNLNLSFWFSTPQQNRNSISIMAIVAVAETKVWKDLFLLRLYSNLRVTKDDKEVVVGNGSSIFLH